MQRNLIFRLLSVEKIIMLNETLTKESLDVDRNYNFSSDNVKKNEGQYAKQLSDNRKKKKIELILTFRTSRIIELQSLRLAHQRFRLSLW